MLGIKSDKFLSTKAARNLNSKVQKYFYHNWWYFMKDDINSEIKKNVVEIEYI